MPQVGPITAPVGRGGGGGEDEAGPGPSIGSLAPVAPADETPPPVVSAAPSPLSLIDDFNVDEPVDGVSEEILPLANAPLPEEDFQSLEREVAGTRVVYLRGEPAVPVSALVALGGALLLHILLMSLFLLALFIFAKKGGTADESAPGNAGGSGDGYMVAGEGPLGAPSLAPGVEQLLAHAVTPAVPAAPPLPPPPDTRPPGESLAVTELAPPETDIAIIGTATADDRAGRLKPPPAPAILRPPSNRDTLVVAPPETLPPTKQPPASPPTGAKGTLAAATHDGVGTGGGDDDFSDETLMPLLRADAGDGSDGHGNHGGLDRGGSGANNPEPSLLEWHMPTFADSVYLSPPPRATQCKVTVRADGTVGKVEIVQSCGQKDLDEMWKASLAKGKYRPAYRAGKPYEAEKTIECGFRK